MATQMEWHKVLDKIEDLPEGRVMSVTAGHQGICLTHFEGKISALDMLAHIKVAHWEKVVSKTVCAAHGMVGIITLVRAKHLDSMMVLILFSPKLKTGLSM